MRVLFIMLCRLHCSPYNPDNNGGAVVILAAIPQTNADLAMYAAPLLNQLWTDKGVAFRESVQGRQV